MIDLDLSRRLPTLFWKNFFRAKIERVFLKNSVKVSLCSTSNTGEGVSPILGVPRPSSKTPVQDWQPVPFAPLHRQALSMPPSIYTYLTNIPMHHISVTMIQSFNAARHYLIAAPRINVSSWCIGRLPAVSTLLLKSSV